MRFTRFFNQKYGGGINRRRSCFACLPLK